MMVEEPNSSQQKQPPSQITQRVLDALELEGIEFTVVPIETEDEIMFVEVTMKSQKIEALGASA